MKNTRLFILLSISLFILSYSSQIYGGVTLQQSQTFSDTICQKVSLNYLIWLPDNYEKTGGQGTPMLIFLHGAGERGSNLELVKKHGPPKLIEEGQKFPFIIVSPQCPENVWWTFQIDALDALLTDLLKKYNIDENKIYLTGLSMGGFGTWMWSMLHPERFAAIAPVCGGGEAFLTNRIKHLPIWVFHGAKDPVVPLQRSGELVNALKYQGADARFTVYPEAGHDSWTETYNNPALYQWFQQQSKISK